MYQVPSDYYADLGRMRGEASAVAGNVRKTVALNGTYRFTIRRFEPDYGLFHLHFTMPDFYFRAIEVDQTAKLYTFYQSTFAIVNRTSVKQSFGCEYDEMGWQKSHDALTLTLHDVNAAFFDFAGGVPGKGAFRSIVVAFAEGFRFTRIAKKIVDGTPIGGKELDWSAPGATVYQGP